MVKDDSGAYEAFIEQGSSTSLMTAAKVMVTTSRLPGCSGQAADAESVYVQVSGWWSIVIFKFQIWITRYVDTSTKTQWPKSWSSMEDPVVPLERNLYGHPLAGLLGPMASIPFFTAPVSFATRFDPQCFRVLLLRRLWCPLPLSSATCRCGQPLDSRSHHRGACARAGVLGRRGFPLVSCAARICREAGARVSQNIRVQDLGLLPVPRVDNRRLVVVADGLPLFHGAQLAVDTTMVNVVRADGAPRRQCVGRDGAALDQARQTKELRYPELSGDQGRARLVVLACETGGRWSEEAHDFLRQLARARARWEPPVIRQAARRAWFRRWCTALACCAAQAFALSLLERRGGHGVDGEMPSTCDVIWDDHRGGWSNCFQLTRVCLYFFIDFAVHFFSLKKKIMVLFGRQSRSSWAKSVRSFSDRTVMGKAIWENLLKYGWEKVSNWECIFGHDEKIMFICVSEWHQIGWKETQHYSDVESTHKKVGLGDSTSFFDHVYFDCTQRQCERSKDITYYYRTMFESRIFRWNNTKLPCLENLSIFLFTYDMGHAKKCVERYCEKAKKTTQQLYKVFTPCIDEYHFKKEEKKKRLSNVKSILSNCSEIFVFDTYWKTWYPMIIDQTCTIHYKMDQILWQTIMSFDFLHSSCMWMQNLLSCG